MNRVALLLATVLAALAPVGVGSAPAAPAQGDDRAVAIGYVDMPDDARYRTDSAYAGIVFRTLGRPFAGAELGLADARATGKLLHIDFSLVHASGDVPALAGEIRQWVASSDVHFVLVDLLADKLTALADAVADAPVMLLNVSAADDALRGAGCKANVLHVYPSASMLSDALVEYLVSRHWKRILVLQGGTPADATSVKALVRSAKKFGASVVDTRPFVLSNNPRDRSETNVALMTTNADYDVVYVADSVGEFAREVPYRTSLPRPVVGSTGLSPLAWHWSWYRNGAPQLQHRFEAAAMPRRMNGEAWAAWAAVKAVAEASLRAKGQDFAAMRDYLLSDRLHLDGVKGRPMSFRTWDHQLRQPILLATPDAVVATAPVAGFLHQHDVLDTLGVDQPESTCHLPAPGTAG